MGQVELNERDWCHPYSLNLFISNNLYFLSSSFHFTFCFHRLDEHLIACHQYQKDLYRCDICSKSYCYRPSLLRHRAIIHGELRKYPCENCTKVSKFNQILIFYQIKNACTRIMWVGCYTFTAKCALIFLSFFRTKFHVIKHNLFDRYANPFVLAK